MKIVYCVNSIRYLGGIQRVTVVKANALAEIPGNEVYVVMKDNIARLETYKTIFYGIFIDDDAFLMPVNDEEMLTVKI